MPFYHVTAPENLGRILKEGIIANGGDIFLFDSEEMMHPYEEGEIITVAESIARNQCGLEKYVVLEIDETGLTGEMVPDNVGEFTAPVQWILKQTIIKSEFISDSWDESYYK